MGIDKIIAAVLLIFLITIVTTYSKPVEEPNGEVKELNAQDEMMETAESQNPFLPRFAMKKLKERREQARAQRRSGQGYRRLNPPNHVKCPQLYRRYYVSIL